MVKFTASCEYWNFANVRHRDVTGIKIQQLQFLEVLYCHQACTVLEVQMLKFGNFFSRHDLHIVSLLRSRLRVDIFNANTSNIE